MEIFRMSTKSNALGRMKRDVSAWLLMAIPLILFAFYIWYPLIYGVFLSFATTEGFTVTGAAGLANYARVVADPLFVKSILNSFEYTIWSLVIGFLVPIILAIMINELVHCSSLFRVALYFPNIVPVIATVLMWRFMMEPGPGGVINTVLAQFGVEPFGWLQVDWATKPLIITTLTWKSAGATTLIYIARLKSINQELYEAAAIDGAGVWQRMKNITLPQVFNLARLLLILQVLAVFQLLVEPMLMTSGGPNGASESMMLLNYHYAFRDFQIGNASAVGVIVSLILVVLTFVYLKATKENETY
jgi:multiple sugar transport system permease protein